MLCGKARWVAVLLCAYMVMLAAMGQPVDNREDMSTDTPHMEAVSSEEKMPTPAPDAAHYVHQSQSLSAGEQEFVLKRKETALKSLERLGINCSLDSVPHIALLGSGGGQRAAVGLVGSLYQMEEEGLLDTLLYLGGVSGSAWSMSSLYSDPQWSSNMDAAVSRLSGPGVGPEEALVWLGERAQEEHFSLTDIWGVMISAGIMKQLDLRHLSKDGTDVFNPYPIYNAVNKNCLHHGPEKAKWFEMTPHEAGFTDLGLFINTSDVGSRIHEAGPEGIVGSVVADEQTLVNYMLDWLKGLVATADTVPQQMKSFWDVLERGYFSLLKITEVIRNNTEDATVLSDLDNLQKTLKESMNLNSFLASFGKKRPKQPKLILEQWCQKMLAPLNIWSQSLDEGPLKETVSWLIQKAIPLIGKWEWGTTENFLYQYPGAGVPSCVSLKEHLQLIDSGVMLNIPYPPFLGEKRDVDLLVTLDYGADDIFKTLTLARDYAAAVKKPFPEIDDTILEERDWPKDCYVLEGKEKEPTIVYMPLFNRNNCKDPEEVKAKMEEFSTFQPPFSQDQIESVLETAKANMKSNKETLLTEMNKAALRRHNRG